MKLLRAIWHGCVTAHDRLIDRISKSAVHKTLTDREEGSSALLFFTMK